MSATGPSQTVYSIGYDFHAGNGTAGTGTDNGNVFGIINYKDTTHGRDQTFTYDALNRLLTAQNTGTDCSITILQNKTEYWGNSYVYDAWGNLLQKNVTKCGAEGLTVTADAHNWIHASGTDYLYDAAGNMTRNVTPTVQTYTYDQENRLTGAAGYTYTYDGDGNRVRKSNGNTAGDGTLYWYMTPGVVAESDLAGTLKSEYVFFDGERVARRDGATGAGGTSSHRPRPLRNKRRDNLLRLCNEPPIEMPSRESRLRVRFFLMPRPGAENAIISRASRSQKKNRKKSAAPKDTGAVKEVVKERRHFLACREMMGLSFVPKGRLLQKETLRLA
jgi:YD repeat-containing protein